MLLCFLGIADGIEMIGQSLMSGLVLWVNRQRTGKPSQAFADLAVFQADLARFQSGLRVIGLCHHCSNQFLQSGQPALYLFRAVDMLLPFLGLVPLLEANSQMEVDLMVERCDLYCLSK